MKAKRITAAIRHPALTLLGLSLLTACRSLSLTAGSAFQSAFA